METREPSLPAESNEEMLQRAKQNAASIVDSFRAFAEGRSETPFAYRYFVAGEKFHEAMDHAILDQFSQDAITAPDTPFTVTEYNGYELVRWPIIHEGDERPTGYWYFAQQPQAPLPPIVQVH